MRRRVDDGRHGLAAGDSTRVKAVAERPAIVVLVVVVVVIVIVALAEGGAGGNWTRTRVTGRRKVIARIRRCYCM